MRFAGFLKYIVYLPPSLRQADIGNPMESAKEMMDRNSLRQNVTDASKSMAYSSNSLGCIVNSVWTVFFASRSSTKFFFEN